MISSPSWAGTTDSGCSPGEAGRIAAQMRKELKERTIETDALQRFSRHGSSDEFGSPPTSGTLLFRSRTEPQNAVEGAARPEPHALRNAIHFGMAACS